MVTTFRRASALAVILAAAFAGACGGDDSQSGSSSGGGGAYSAAKSARPAAGDLKLTASESGGLSFDRSTLTASAGTVTVTLDNPGGNQMPHGVSIEGNGVDQEGEPVQPGNTAKVTAKLKAGTYTFYCPVDGHEQKGMKGTLTVR